MARRPEPRRGDRSDGRVLTARQRAVLTGLARGDSVEEIALELGLSPDTVRVHIRNARMRLGARSRAHAVVIALRRGAIDA